MAEKRDDSSEPNDLDARKRATPPSNDAPAPPARDLKSFLPDDSFLLDLDDELVGPSSAPEGAASDEFLLVDDDLASAAAAAAAKPSTAAPLRASEEPAELEPDAAAPMAPLAAELSPVDAWDDATAVAKRAAANPDAGAPEPVEPEAVEPAMADSGSAPSRPSLPSWITRDEGDLPSFVADEDGEDHDNAATAAATAGSGSDEAGAGASEAIAEAESPAMAEAAAATEGTVVSMPRRRRWLVAAGLLAAAGLSAAGYFELQRRGLLPFSTDGDAGQVAVAPREPAATPTEEPVAAVEPEPVAPEPTVTEAPSEPPVAEAPVAEPAPTDETTPPVAPEPPVAAVPSPEEAPVATPPATEPSVVVDAPASRSPLAATPRVRNELEGTETIVQLVNGHLFRGRITRVRDTRVTLRIGAGECVFDMSEITLLDSTQPEYRREKDMPEASVVLNNGQRLRGRLMKQTSEDVVLVVANGQVVFPRSDVREVSFTGRIHF